VRAGNAAEYCDGDKIVATATLSDFRRVGHEFAGGIIAFRSERMPETLAGIFDALRV